MKLISHQMYPYSPDQGVFEEINQVIQANLERFRKPGVLTVRPGYQIVGGKLTRKPAIVVLVAQKLRSVPFGQSLPISVGQYPVDVRQAGSLDLMRARDPERFSKFMTVAPKELLPPTFPYENDLQAHRFAASTISDTDAARSPQKDEIEYKPPEGPSASLNAVTSLMSITCHASPDAGWKQLKGFFEKIEAKLTVGIYDFTAAHVLDNLTKALEAAHASMTLTIDHPIKNPTADQTDEETVNDLEQSLGNAFKCAWALERRDPEVRAFIFPSAYHIKVAVSDTRTTWLSSGNWNRSNQPNIDPIQNRDIQTKQTAKSSDRDWHVIIDHPGLSETFQAYLQNDYAVASQYAANKEVIVKNSEFICEGTLTDEEIADLTSETTVSPRDAHEFFAPLRIPAEGTRNITIQPLLTPDPNSYQEKVLALISSATSSLYIQMQYIHPSSDSKDQGFADLINAVIRKQKEGLSIRIILSQWQIQNDKNGNPQWWERLQQTGLALSDVRLQWGVHNKGMIVDSKIVMLGSQNWSGDGVLRNRDASVIILDTEAANYYESIFLHDWLYMSVAGPIDYSY